LEFLDPRAGVEAVSAPGDPYGEPFRVRPQSGLLVVFPSWLYHWVHPYAGERPRIAISFNATLGAQAEEQAQSNEAVAPVISHTLFGNVGIGGTTPEGVLCHAGHELEGRT
jgi:hypothetical protein